MSLHLADQLAQRVPVCLGAGQDRGRRAGEGRPAGEPGERTATDQQRVNTRRDHVRHACHLLQRGRPYMVR